MVKVANIVKFYRKISKCCVILAKQKNNLKSKDCDEIDGYMVVLQSVLKDYEDVNTPLTTMQSMAILRGGLGGP